jgi:hypothetical protein
MQSFAGEKIMEYTLFSCCHQVEKDEMPRFEIFSFGH